MFGRNKQPKAKPGHVQIIYTWTPAQKGSAPTEPKEQTEILRIQSSHIVAVKLTAAKETTITTTDGAKVTVQGNRLSELHDAIENGAPTTISLQCRPI